jgi:hypothetical protein
MANGVVISAAVEGIVDEAVMRKLISHVGATPGDVYGKQGKSHLRQKIAAYNNAARHTPWTVLVDLNGEAACAPALRQSWLAAPAPMLCFRIAVREVEAWLLSDAERLADFLGVARGRIPRNVEQLNDPKAEMVNLARNSRRRDIRTDMVPRPESGRAVGAAYSSRLIEFVSQHWRPDRALLQADSLRRAVDCLRRLAAPAA